MLVVVGHVPFLLGEIFWKVQNCCFDDFCTDPPIQDDPNLFDMNVQERVDLFVEEMCKQAESFQTNHIIATMGSDFQFENARRWFKNLDKLIKYVNEVGCM